MGICTTENQIKNNNDLLMLLSIMAEIRPFLIDERLALRGGIILFTEDRKDCINMENKLLDFGGIECKKINKANLRVANHLAGIHEYSRSDKVETILQYLGQEEFLPIILTYGAIPDFLECNMEMIPLLKSDNSARESEILEELQYFRKYVHANPDILQREIRLFKTSEVYIQSEDESLLKIALEATVAAFCYIYRNDHAESETELRRTQLRKVVDYYVNLAIEHGDEYEILDSIKSVVENYIDKNRELLISSCDQIENEVWKAVEKSDAILFDEEGYYFPEKIMRKACEPLLEMVSFVHIKYEMYEAGFLYSNNVASGNYTIKKSLMNSYGYRFRGRFLKIRRDFFAAMGELGLEERRGVSMATESPFCLEGRE